MTSFRYPKWDGLTLRPLDPASQSALLVERADGKVDLLAFVRSHRDDLLDTLDRAGAILFRGFPLGSVAWMGDFARACSRRGVLEYTERSSPRTAMGQGVYTSTEYPAQEEILLHNENAYAAVWPERLCLFCESPAESGGQTVLADTRQVLCSLDPWTRAEFDQRGVLYHRTYSDELGVNWRAAFQTASTEEVNRLCRARGYESVWLADGRLRTRRVGRATQQHARTGEPSWFNHAMFFHVSSLPDGLREALCSIFPENELPANTYYGDGSPIADDTIAYIRAAYERHAFAVNWCVGDVLMLDNVACAHGRKPFRGCRRRVYVAMCDDNAGVHA